MPSLCELLRNTFSDSHISFFRGELGMEGIISVTHLLETVEFSCCNKLRPTQNWIVVVSEDRERR